MKTPRRPLSLSVLAAIAGTVVFLPLSSGCGGAGTAATNANNGDRSYGGNGPGGNNADGSSGAASAGKPVSGPTGRLGVFVTASGAKPEYDHIWASILRVEALDANEKAVTLYDSTDGRTLDLSRLGSGKEAYVLLGVAATPAGRTYNRVRVTFDKSLLLFAPGENAAKLTPFSDALARDTEGHPVLSFPLSSVRDLGSGKDDVVIGFDLSKLSVAEGRVVPAVQEGSKAGLADASRQEEAALRGTVSEISGTLPDAVFTLTGENGQSASVKATGLTALYNDAATPDPTLADGKAVEVRGIFDTTTHRFAAREVVVLTDAAAKTTSPAQISGVVSGINKDAATFAITAEEVRGIAPAQRAVTVLLAPDAALLSRSGLPLGADAFWSALSAKGSSGVLVRLEGDYEPVTGTLRARAAKVVEPASAAASAHEVEVEGMPQTPNAEAGTLSVGKLLHWNGLITPGAEKNVPVTTTAATLFRDEKGEFVAAATFFTQAKEANRPVRVVGLYTANGALTATRMELRPVLVQEVKKPEAKKPDAKKPEASADAEKAEKAVE